MSSTESRKSSAWKLSNPSNTRWPQSGEIYTCAHKYSRYSDWDRTVCWQSLSSTSEEKPCDDSTPIQLDKLRYTESQKLSTQLDRFAILGILGTGQHATVYRALDPFLGRQVALKLPRPEIAITGHILDRFVGEARALARLHHPRIVSIYEAGHDGTQCYLVMALIEGPSLAEQISRKCLSYHQSAKIVAQLAEALDYAHGLGIIHRDVKPANVRLDGSGCAYLMDFGIAYLPGSGELPAPPGIILGTPAYLAPEQAQGGQTEHLPASDQYSLGAVLYESLCGQPPFVGHPSYVIFHAIHHEPPLPRAIDCQIPKPLAAICRKAMAKRPDRRYSSCRELADALHDWLAKNSYPTNRWPCRYS